MSLYEFNRLSEQDQLTAVWELSNFVISRRDGRLYRNLYAIENFFVEVCYNPDLNQTVGCRAFSSISQLDPYLLGINLPSLSTQ